MPFLERLTVGAGRIVGEGVRAYQRRRRSKSPPSSVLDLERRRFVMILRQITDCLNEIPSDKLADPMLRLSGPLDALCREARLVLKRPFGE